jgi:hypothetical protein
MRKIFKLGMVLCALALCSCNNVEPTKKLNCNTISIKEDEKTIFEGHSDSLVLGVYEYKNSKGDSIYTDTHLTVNYYCSQDVDKVNPTIHVYENSSLENYEVYNYVGLIGWVSQEYNFYLDPDERSVETEVICKEYSSNSNLDGKVHDNKKAYECSKKEYYKLTNDILGSYDNYYYDLKKDSAQSAYERHSYFEYGENSIVDYTLKNI